MQRMSSWQIALRRIEMPISQFLLFFVGGAAVAGLVFAFILISVTGGTGEQGLFTGSSSFLLILLLPLITASAAFVFPLLEVRRSATMIEKEMHMFITRMGILSLGEVAAQSIFDILKQMSDYVELAIEVKRI